jgi:hypothetical protein
MLKPVPGEIYFLTRPYLRESKHPHPVLIVRRSRDAVTINYMSSSFELKRPQDFSIDFEAESKEEIATTGLKKSSYLIQRQVFYNVPLEELEGILLGKITGKLKEKIEDWWGEPIGP